MFGQQVKNTVVATAAASALWLAMGTGAANATLLTDWNLNLSVDNGATFKDLADITHINQMGIDGSVSTSTITQHFVGGSPLGQAFTDTGTLRLATVGLFPSGGADVADYLTSGSGGTGVLAKRLYFTFTGLTGTFFANASCTTGCVKFNAGVGTVNLWLDSDTDLDPTTGTSLSIASFTVLDPSKGSNLNFFGGAGPTGVIDVTLGLLTANPFLYTDAGGNDIGPLVLHLGDVNALCSPTATSCTSMPRNSMKAVTTYSSARARSPASRITRPSPSLA